jgi:DNA-directed RNA polymerase specialized sigma24 family protein
MLEELSKQDELWYFYALKICGDDYLARDLVNDMYLRVYDKNIKIEGDGRIYVYRILKSIYLNQLKKAKVKTVDIEELYNDISDEESETLKRFDCLELLKDVSFFHREVLLLTHEFSLRGAEEESGVPYYTLQYHKKQALDYLKKKYG